jgi:hypothetical protein
LDKISKQNNNNKNNIDLIIFSKIPKKKLTERK